MWWILLLLLVVVLSVLFIKHKNSIVNTIAKGVLITVCIIIVVWVISVVFVIRSVKF